jgi:hypothetical protein
MESPMSYDENDARLDAEWEAASKALYPEHAERAVEEFTAARLQSFYIENRDVARPAFEALDEARALLPDHPAAALVFAATALELGLKMVVLKPITYGLIHDEALADEVANALLSLRPPLVRLRSVCVKILCQHAGVDLSTHRRANASQPLWSEMERLQEFRNGFLHNGRHAASEEASTAVDVAQEFLETVLPMLFARLSTPFHKYSDVFLT